MTPTDSPPAEPHDEKSSEEGKGQAESQSSQRVVRSTIVVGLLTVFSRITGILRESVLAGLLGTSVAADAFRLAFMIPNLMRRLVGEGAATSAFVAVYSGITSKRGKASGTIFAEKFLTLWLILVAVLAVLGVILIGPFLRLIAPLLSGGPIATPENIELTIDISRILFWYLFFVGGVAAAQGVLNARWKFGAPAFVSALFNLVFVGSVFVLIHLFRPTEVVFAVSFAVFCGGFVQLVSLIPSLRRAGVGARLRSPRGDEGVREVLRLMVPGLLGAGVYQINATLSLFIAGSLEAEGSMASLGYSNRLMEFVLGVFVVALSTVSLTSLARLAAAQNIDGLVRQATEALGLVIFITVPSTVGLYLLREPLIRLLFQSGKFQDESVRMTSKAFEYHAFGLAFVGIARILVAVFHARKDLRTPVIVSLLVLPISIGLALVLSHTQLQHAGVALAASISAGIQAVALLILLRRRLPQLPLKGLAKTVAKTIASAAVMALVCHFVLIWWPPPMPTAGQSHWALKLPQAIWVLTVVSAGATVFFAVAGTLRMPEGSLLLNSMRRRRS